jgi:putative transposase
VPALSFDRLFIPCRQHFVEAKKRFGLCVLDYIVTSNHVHLLVKDTGSNVIAQSVQLIAGRTAQVYNQRKKRHGAFWEDRYHATAIEADDHLHRCLIYIDLNVIRGVVNHPGQWKESGFPTWPEAGELTVGVGRVVLHLF